MDRIPPEILLQIFNFIDGPAASELCLHEQPSMDFLKTQPGYSRAPLKAASLVSRSWRSLVLSKLFRHVLWKPNVYSLSAFTINPIPLLRFLVENHLERCVITCTMVIDFDDTASANYQMAPQIRTADLEWLWDQLFSVIDPLRFTILGRPVTLAALLSRMLYLDDAWSFDMPYHILSLARSVRSAAVEVTTDDAQKQPSPSSSSGALQTAQPTTPAVSSRSRARKAASSPLFTVRPWTSLLLNEGSSTKVYRAYEFFLRRPPSILGALLGCEEFPNNTPLIPPTVVDFNYIAIFPLSSHFEILLQHLPRVDRLFVQLTPKPGNGILENNDEMKHIDPADLWMERNTSYSFLMRELTSNSTPQVNWALLQVFESGDAADRDAWEMALQFLEMSEMHEWKAEREGVLVRHLDVDQPLGWTGEANGHIVESTSTPASWRLLV